MAEEPRPPAEKPSEQDSEASRPRDEKPEVKESEKVREDLLDEDRFQATDN